ncbi:MAG: ATP-binding domain-containing protein [Clostridia bacterium]|nr:ATP-binding domain-containing protein [Clostridia bacterium]
MTEIVRQAADNPIIQVATLARKGEYIPYGKYGDKVGVISKSLFRGEDRKRLLLAADQVLCGTNRTRNALNQEIRRYKNIPQDAVLPIAGEKLICTLNNWEKPLDKSEKFHLVNGVIGYADNVEERIDALATMDFRADFMQDSVKVPFDTGIFVEGRYYHGYGNRAVTLANGMVISEYNVQMLRRFKSVGDEPVCRFEFAYAITCHKAQGSEFDCVVVFDESWAFGEEWNRWLYTAITRAKEKLLIIR